MEHSIIYSAIGGVILYFICEYKSKKFAWADFKLGYWIKDNWFNVISTVFILWFWLYINDDITKLQAATIGFGWNKIVDYVQDFFSKKSQS